MRWKEQGVKYHVKEDTFPSWIHQRISREFIRHSVT